MLSSVAGQSPDERELLKMPSNALYLVCLSSSSLFLRRSTCHLSSGRGALPHLPTEGDMHQHVGPSVAWSELSSQLSAVADNVWMLQSREAVLQEQLKAKDE